MVEDKFGEGSDEHCQSLQELSDACLSAGKPGLAAPMLINLSRQEGNSFKCVVIGHGFFFPQRAARYL